MKRDSLLHSSLNLAFRQRKLHDIFIFGMAHHEATLQTRERTNAFQMMSRFEKQLQQVKWAQFLSIFLAFQKLYR